MILPIFSWWLISGIFAAAVFPISWHIFHRLPDRGYGFLRTFGLVLCGYGFWMGASLQLLPNNYSGVVTTLLVLIMIAFFTARGSWHQMRAWLHARRRSVLFMELVFLLAFVGWAWVRANNPEITGTEKPMELAFVNSILRSEGFPPRDPWLSGYAISYYYFGYVLISMLTMLSGVAPGVGFNLGNSLWFGLVAVGSYSLIYNWINRSSQGEPRYLPALVGPLATLISGNLGGFLEVLHSKHVFWRPGVDGVLQSRFWTWLGLENLENAPIGSPGWLPQRYLWWWRSSRVIRDLDLNGIPIGTQSIDEFPFFSFLLADNHPHLLALPVALLALGFSLQLILQPIVDPGSAASGFRLRLDQRRIYPWLIGQVLLSLMLSLLGAGPMWTLAGVLIGFIKWMLLTGLILLGCYVGFLLFSGRLATQLSRGQLVFGGWLFGSLAFLNTWDFLPYLAVIAFIVLWRTRNQGVLSTLKASSPSLLMFVLLGAAFYLPWYPTFASQLSGILPHMLQPTRLPHFITMFGPLLAPISIWLLLELVRAWRKAEWRWMLGLTLGVPAGLLLTSWLLAFGIVLTDGGAFSRESLLGILGVASLDEMIRSTLRIRLTGSWTAISLGGILAAAVVLLRRNWERGGETDSNVWVHFLIIVGALLILGPEFLYLRDQFGLRMNTIFKFYYATWILWSLAAGILIIRLWGQRGIRWLPIQAIAVIPLLMGLVYPVFSVWTKTHGFQPVHGRTLDGSMHPSYMNSDDREAIQWMNTHLPDGVLAEAVGGSYTYYARVSTHTGLPTVLGWPGHEGQWRGGYQEQGSRQEDLRQLYQSPDWTTTLSILDRYAIDYVYLGELERQTYPPIFEAKFEAFMELIYANGSVHIYGRSGGPSQ